LQKNAHTFLSDPNFSNLTRTIDLLNITLSASSPYDVYR
jgi:hypothetical protein